MQIFVRHTQEACVTECVNQAVRIKGRKQRVSIDVDAVLGTAMLANKSWSWKGSDGHVPWGSCRRVDALGI